MNVSQLLSLKGAVVVTVKPTDTIGRLSELLSEKKIGAAVVSRDGRSIEGVISERDIAYGVSKYKDKLYGLPVTELMTKSVITCAPTDSLATAASTMQARKIRHLPVEIDQRLVGMVSIRDVLNFRVGELQEQTAMLLQVATEPVREPQDRE